MVWANLREISRGFLRESSRLRIFVRGMNAKKEFFSWADLYVCYWLLMEVRTYSRSLVWDVTSGRNTLVSNLNA